MRAAQRKIACSAGHLGIPMDEVAIATNGHNINLVFSDLTVETVATGYTPFTVPSTGPDAKVPLP